MFAISSTSERGGSPCGLFHPWVWWEGAWLDSRIVPAAPAVALARRGKGGDADDAKGTVVVGPGLEGVRGGGGGGGGCTRCTGSGEEKGEEAKDGVMLSSWRDAHRCLIRLVHVIVPTLGLRGHHCRQTENNIKNSVQRNSSFSRSVIVRGRHASCMPCVVVCVGLRVVVGMG